MEPSLLGLNTFSFQGVGGEAMLNLEEYRKLKKPQLGINPDGKPKDEEDASSELRRKPDND